MRKKRNYISIHLFLSVLAILITACTHQPIQFAQVRDINIHRLGKNRVYIVQPGDSLYSIAFQLDKDYRQLATLNHLKSPYILHHGDTILISNPHVTISKRTHKKTKKISSHKKKDFSYPAKTKSP
jgi:lipoprotein NlpD